MQGLCEEMLGICTKAGAVAAEVPPPPREPTPVRSYTLCSAQSMLVGGGLHAAVIWFSRRMTDILEYFGPPDCQAAAANTSLHCSISDPVCLMHAGARRGGGGGIC